MKCATFVPPEQSIFLLKNYCNAQDASQWAIVIDSVKHGTGPNTSKSARKLARKLETTYHAMCIAVDETSNVGHVMSITFDDRLQPSTN